MSREILFSPLVEPWVLIMLAVAMTAMVFFALWRGLSGWWLRGLAAGLLMLALFNPSLQSEDRAPLSDIIVLLVDRTASQRVSDRPEQTETALAAVRESVAGLPNTELRVVEVTDADGNEGSLLMTALNSALADEPRARIAGVIFLTDGQLHDVGRAPELPAPLHVLLSGHDTDWDRRLIVRNAPAFAILGESVTLTLELEDQGKLPPDHRGVATLEMSVDGGESQQVQVPVGKKMELPVSLPHGGMNVIRFSTPMADGELTDRNNSAVVQINGVRDRLRVLLVSGEPHAGERTWRNLLKSDSSVDLVHFTILRPPEKQDGVPVAELSLIAFPTRELFLEKIDEFDLIIFDRYKRRGILPSLYLDNIRQYVEDGGAVLFAAGPDFASATSLYRTPLGEIIPATPSARVVDEPFLPQITELGNRHPVTEGLDAQQPGADVDAPPWGRWFRLVDVLPKTGETVMTGAGERPLLVLDRVGEGRVALLTSDQAWLWSRGYEGGGPQLELLRRLAHWMMKEPELEEEGLWVEAEGQRMTIIRRTLTESVPDIEITGPDGTVVTVTPEEVSPGRFQAEWDAPEIGLYRLRNGDHEAVAALGPSAPREFEQTIASAEALDPIVTATRGGVRALEDGVPRIRAVREGRPAAGRGWIGITPREAYQTANVTVQPLLPSWVLLLLAAFLIIGAWLWEGRRRTSSVG